MSAGTHAKCAVREAFWYKLEIFFTHMGEKGLIAVTESGYFRMATMWTHVE